MAEVGDFPPDESSGLEAQILLDPAIGQGANPSWLISRDGSAASSINPGTSV
jgi:hypothetical protein